MKKILLLDFDGVLHSYRSGWQGARIIPDDPVEGMIGWLACFLVCYCCPPDNGWEVCIYSSRSRQFGGKKAMKRWLIKHGLEESWLALVKFPTKKPPAYLTIDDRAICFDGHCEDLTDRIMKFKTWLGTTKI